MPKSDIVSTTISTLSFPPRLGEPFCGWKTSATIKPRSLDDADLLTHLEGDSRVRSYAPLDPASVLQRPHTSALPDSIWYHVEHEAGSYVYLLLGRTVRGGAETVIQSLNDTIIQHGRRLLTLDPHCLRREPRWTNVKQVLSCRSYTICPLDRFRVLDCVDTYGSAEIEICAAICRSSEDPIGAVLSLVADGSLVLNLEQQLSLSSLLYLPTATEEDTSGFSSIDQGPTEVVRALTKHGESQEKPPIKRNGIRIVRKEPDNDAHCRPLNPVGFAPRRSDGKGPALPL